MTDFDDLHDAISHVIRERFPAITHPREIAFAITPMIHSERKAIEERATHERIELERQRMAAPLIAPCIVCGRP